MRTREIVACATLTALCCCALGRQAAAQEGVPCVAPPQPEQEPNNTPPTATPLTLFGEAVMNRAPGSISPAGDVDYFRIQAPAGSRLSILVDTGVLPQLPGGNSRDSVVAVLAGDILIEVDDDDGTGFGPVTSGEASSIVGVQVGGVITISVTAKNAGDVLSPYVLWVGASTAPFQAEVEPNDWQGTAMLLDVLPVLGSLSGASDVDWYVRGFLGGGPHAIFVDGDPERDGTSTDVRIDFAPIVPPVPPVNSSIGSGSPPPGSEAVYLGAASFPAQFFRLSGPAAGTYSLRVLYIGGDDCQVPVRLQSFEVR